MKRTKIGIIGSGKMGTNIINYLFDYDLPLYWICSDSNQIELLKNKITKKLNRLLRNKIITYDKYSKKLEDIVVNNNLEFLSDSDLVIESITEDLDIKRRLFEKLNNIVKKDCVLATNSSSIKPSEIVIDKEMQKKLIGIHFFYPVELKNIIEVIKTIKTDKEVFKKTKLFLENINRKYIILDEKNSFILNRVMLDIQFYAFNTITSKKINIRAFEDFMKSFIPTGIFEFIDSVGIDTMYNSVKNYIKDYEKKEYCVPLLNKFEDMITKNNLGKKTGKGFFIYKNNFKENFDKKSEIDLITIMENIKYILINSCLKLLENKILKEKEIEYSFKEYLDIEKGPFELLKESNKKDIFKRINRIYQESKYKNYLPSNLLN